MAKASVQVNNYLFYSCSVDLILARRIKRFAIKKQTKLFPKAQS